MKQNNDLVLIISDSIKSIKKQNLHELREASNKAINLSSIYQDKYSISFSVILYTLFKIMNKNNYLHNENYPQIRKIILSELNISRNALRKNKTYILSKSLRKIIRELEKLDKQAGKFMQEAIESSKIKKAYGLYSSGISTGKAAQLLGISKWELQPYLGKTRESENPYSQSRPVEERVKIAKEIFNIKWNR